MASTPGPCTGSPAAPAASAQRAPATGRPRLHLSAQAGRLVKENHNQPGGSPTPCQTLCQVHDGQCLLPPHCGPARDVTPSQQWKFREKGAT